MDSAELVVRITGDIDDIESKLNRTANAASSMADKIENAGRKMSSAGSAMTTGLTLPLVALGGFAIKSAVDFESAFAGVRKTIDGSEADFARLEKGIRQMSKELPASAVEIAAVAETAGQLGVSKDHILAFTRTMIDLGESTTLTADEAATAMARIANITQLPQDQFDELASTLVALGNAGASTEADIVNMAMRIAGAGAQIGLTQAEIMGFAAALSDVGIEAEAGGSAISRVFIDISKAVASGGDDLAAFAEVAGKSTSEFAKQFRVDAAGAMVAFVAGLGRVKEEGGNVFAVLDELGLSEIRTRDAMLRLSGAGEGLATSLGIATSAFDENVAATDEAAKRYATTGAQLEMFRNRVTDAAITLGAAMVPALMTLLDTLEPVGRWLMQGITWFSELSPTVQGVVLAIAALIAVAGPVLIFLGAIFSAVSVLMPVLAAIVSPIGLMVIGIGLLIAALVLAYQRSEEFRAVIDTVWQVLQVAIDWVVRFASGLVDVLGGAFGMAKGLFDAFAGLLTGDWSRMWDGVQRLTDGAIDVVEGLVRAGMLRFAQIVIAGIGWVLREFGGLPGRIMVALGGMAGRLYDVGWDAMQGLWNGLRDRATAVLSWAANMGKRILGAIGNAIGWGSPATEFVAMGEDSMRGLMLGVESYERKLLAQLSRLGQATLSAGAIALSPVPAPSLTGATTSAGAYIDYDRMAAAIVKALASQKGIEMTFNTPVDPMHVAREVSWAMGD